LALTPKGRDTFAPLNQRSDNEVSALLHPLGEAEQQRLVDAMRTIEALLGASAERPAAYLLRPHRAGDMGWVVQRHGALYAQEYGWNEQFEALVAEIAAAFLRSFDPQWERCWIAEQAGENVGSVFVVRHGKTAAKLRLLIVDPKARGLGIGARLVEECIHFSRQTGYRKLVLWTNSVLTAARHLYRQAGFDLVHAEPHHSFGHDLVGETWELKL
jgi:GNAT superfamily N-acetyltransferase